MKSKVNLLKSMICILAPVKKDFAFELQSYFIVRIRFNWNLVDLRAE